MDRKTLEEFLSEMGYLKILTLSALFLVGLVLFLSYNQYLMMGVLMLISVGGAFAARFFRITTVGIEFTTFAVVVAGLEFGPAGGALIASLLITVQMFGGGHKGAYVLWVIPTFVIAGFLAGVLTFSPVISALAVLAFIHVVCTSLTGLVTPENLPVYMTYTAGNIVLNLVLFTTLLEPVIQTI